jgi:hypothetical protein
VVAFFYGHEVVYKVVVYSLVVCGSHVSLSSLKHALKCGGWMRKYIFDRFQKNFNTSRA